MKLTSCMIGGIGMARAIIQRGGTRSLWPGASFEIWHVGRYVS
jgi:hypothetical protein